MKKILLATTLLSIAVSENILMENHPRPKTAWICDKQLWNKKAKRIPWKDIPSKIEESLNYENDRQFPRISDTRFIGESRKLPSTIIRRHEMERFPQDDLSFDKSKFDSTKPRVLISIGIQEEKNGNDLQENCSKRKSYCKQHQGWQLQQPFYVEEPTWVDIDIDYLDSSQRMDNGDPYILSRGKKIYRIKDPEQMGIEDYEAALGYPNKSKKLLIKSRVRRSAETNDGSQDKAADVKNNQIMERNRYNSRQDLNGDTNDAAIVEIESRGEAFSKIDNTSKEAEKSKDTSYGVVTKNYEKDDPRNLAKRSLQGFKFAKQNRILAKGVITDFAEQKQEIQREDVPNDVETDSSKTAKIDQERFNDSKSRFAININKRKKSVLLKLPETRKKRGLYESDANSKKDEKNETYDPMKTEAYVNELNDPGTRDDFYTLPRNKDPFHNEVERSNKIDTDRNESIEKAWELYYAHRKKLESEGKTKNEESRFEINKDNTEVTDSQLTSQSDSKNPEMQTWNYREKRNVCKTCKIKLQLRQAEWLEDIGKKLQDSLSLERRDKHSDILERLTEPYIISRGKKVPLDFGKNLFSPNNEDRAKTTSLPIAESLLRVLLRETSRCNNNNCDVNANRLANERLSPRDRRGTLDEILAAYDPYYVARGKRMYRDEKDVSLETNARQ
ncbi:PREDICTED: uncharacterized protein LOC105558535 [Vollenhovia emeryi]|uniref:uncharacterized protein LOC105558535 n=1 Tax=Vollenhovia emeryi TaxID=411798 RepID=UPI0005F38925|nr:PREDICTED: uncharacterized protein LOC105558535 [Vollenhovia emeryi]XP_011861663.1 PREDICTED: uncharacterized protein LOC105558535 [Vollenhovia emeryi]